MDEPEAIVEALDVKLPPLRTSPLYTLALLVVAFAMVLLPLVYLSVIALVGYGGFWWATTMHTVFDSVRGRGVIFAAIVYLGPLVAGGILLLFMVKPLFAPATKQATARVLRPEDEPLLFRFVERLCTTVGARMPREIRIDSQVNASAGFHRGWLGLFTGQLVLTIGLPLCAGLNIRQLAGVLAHEFGHFAQTVGMRLTFVIRSVNLWFFRVAFERDAWDEWLRQSSQETDLRIGIVLYAARGFVWLTRQLLKGLAYVGHGISSFMMRQMEYDADRYEIHLGGSKSFEETAERLTILNLWMQGAHHDIQGALRDGRLPDSLPALVMSQHSDIPQEVVDETLQAQREDKKTHWAATHPSDGDRSRAARRQDRPGLFMLDGPAEVLFSDFEALSLELTRSYYLEQLGEEQLEQAQLVPTAQELAQRQLERSAQQAAERFFVGQLNPLRPLPLQPEDGVEPPSQEEARARLVELRERMREGAPDYARSYERFDEADSDQLHAAMATFMLQAHFKLEPGTFGLDTPDRRGATMLDRRAAQQLSELGGELAPFEQAASERLTLALGLLPSEGTEAGAGGAGAPELDLAELRALVRSSARLSPQLLDLRNLFQAAMLLVQQFEESSPSEESMSALRERCEVLHERLQQLKSSLGDAPYPFRVAGAAETTLSKMALPELPEADEIGELLDACAAALHTLLPFHTRTLARLAVAAEQAERALGLEPLEVVPSEVERAA